MSKKQRKRRQKRRDAVPFSRVRKRIPRPGTTMKSDKDYDRKKYKGEITINDD